MADVLTAGNPRAHRVRVYYDGSSTIAEGMSLCYNYLITDNWFGGSVSDAGVVSATTTTAEGSHNEAKYIHVCNPAVAAGDSITPSNTSKLITGGGDDFDALQVGMFVTITGTHVINGNYKITAHSVTNDTITLDMTAATGATADVTVDMDNLHAFAGVVAKGGWCGKTGPQILDIYIPNGAIVPVKTVLAATTVGKTILSINSGTVTFGNPTSDMPSYGYTAGNIDSRAVAIAEETISAAGLLLAKLDDTMFVYQGAQIGSELLAGYVGTVHTAVNKMNVEFAQTDNDACLVHYRALLSGTCQSTTGVYRFDTHITGDMTGTVYGHEIYLEISGDQTAGGIISASRVLLRTRNSDPNLTSLAYVCATQYEWSMTSGAAGSGTLGDSVALRPWFRFLADGDVPTHLFYANSVEMFGGHAGIAGPSATSGSDMMIPVKIGGHTLYLIAYADDNKD